MIPTEPQRSDGPEFFQGKKKKGKLPFTFGLVPFTFALAFRLLRELVSKVPWETAFEGTGVHQCWSTFKHCLLKAQDQAIPKHRKSGRRGRRPAWLTSDLLLELRRKKKVYGCWKEGQATRREYKDAVGVYREKIHVAKAQLELKLAMSPCLWETIKKVFLDMWTEKGEPKKT